MATTRTNRPPRHPLPLCGMNNQMSDMEAPDEIQHSVGSAQTFPNHHPLVHTIWPANLRLHIPSPGLYFDNYRSPNFPMRYPAVHALADPLNAPLAFPIPIGPLPAERYNVLGVTVHDFDYVNSHPNKFFTRYMLWFLEIKDHLLRSICPSDLNDMPCEWDELQGGCPMLRLCKIKHKYPHPHIGIIPECSPDTRTNCKFLHDIETNCRSIGKQLRLPADEQFHTQLCDFVGRGGICDWGHDFESVRAESIREYWKHKEAARAHGSVGVVKGDIWGRRNVWKPVCPVDG